MNKRALHTKAIEDMPNPTGMPRILCGVERLGLRFYRMKNKIGR